LVTDSQAGSTFDLRHRCSLIRHRRSVHRIAGNHLAVIESFPQIILDVFSFECVVTLMTDDFADLVLPLFQQVIDLQDRLAWGESPSIAQVKSQVQSRLDAPEQRAVTNPDLAQEFELIKYGLVAWVDEVLTDSDWGQAVGWGSEEHVLEWDQFRSNLRAEQFFEMADLAERRNASNAIETYLLCAALGFRGVLAHDEEQFRDWIARLYEKVVQASPVSSKPFPDEPEPNAEGLVPLRGPSLLVTVSALTAMSILITLAAYILSVHLWLNTGY